MTSSESYFTKILSQPHINILFNILFRSFPVHTRLFKLYFFLCRVVDFHAILDVKFVNNVAS